MHRYFASCKFTMMLLWKTYLVKNKKEEFKGITRVIKLHFDVVDPECLTVLRNTKSIILSSIQWFQRSGDYIMKYEVVGFHKCHKIKSKQLGFYFSFRHVFEDALNGTCLLLIFQGISFLQFFTIDHFESV